MTDKEKELAEQILKKLESMECSLECRFNSMEDKLDGIKNGIKEFRSEFKGLENVYKNGFSEVLEKMDNIIQKG